LPKIRKARSDSFQSVLMEQVQQTERNVERSLRVQGNDSVTGDLRLHEFTSYIFRNKRLLRVWLPPGYDDPQNATRQYPVLYLNDGQNLFDRATAFAGVEWQVDETADRLIRENATPPLIIVGIDNSAKDRLREYMPYRSLQPMMLRAEGKRYPRFLTDEVMPFIASRCRVATGAENTGLGGSSLGALIALYTAMQRPGVFGKLLVESPSLWASNRQLIKESRGIRRWPKRVVLAVGTAEAGRPDKNQSVVDDVREFAGILRRAGLNEARLRLVIEEGASHSESDWARRFPEALRFLFGQ
jgi:predicted alpha/beta superfamily hydrolase